ncbi:hypothetical protein C8R44DRAFT_987854 [Mycena epipterygia]|nr:hypothetical protein C8R44DRAFT_987854 [Mycena epipterygia]
MRNSQASANTTHVRESLPHIDRSCVHISEFQVGWLDSDADDSGHYLPSDSFTDKGDPATFDFCVSNSNLNDSVGDANHDLVPTSAPAIHGRLRGGHGSDEPSSSGSDCDPLPKSAPPVHVRYGPVSRLRGGHGSDSDDPSSSESDSDAPRLVNKRKHKASPAKQRKRKDKGKGKAPDSETETENGLRVTLGGRKGSKGMFVDELIDITVAPECWAIPPSHRVAYILDLNQTPESLVGPRKTMTVDAFIKKQCQDAWTGPTGSKKIGLASVTILDEGDEILSPEHLASFERWDDSGSTTEQLISAPTRAAKIAEANDVVAIANAFYQSAKRLACPGKYETEEGELSCSGHAVMRKFRSGKSNGKAHFIGCFNWADDDGMQHRFLKILDNVREPILQQLFREEPIVVDDAELNALELIIETTNVSWGTSRHKFVLQSF